MYLCYDVRWKHLRLLFVLHFFLRSLAHIWKQQLIKQSLGLISVKGFMYFDCSTLDSSQGVQRIYLNLNYFVISLEKNTIILNMFISYWPCPGIKTQNIILLFIKPCTSNDAFIIKFVGNPEHTHRVSRQQLHRYDSFCSTFNAGNQLNNSKEYFLLKKVANCFELIKLIKDNIL